MNRVHFFLWDTVSDVGVNGWESNCAQRKAPRGQKFVLSITNHLTKTLHSQLRFDLQLCFCHKWETLCRDISCMVVADCFLLSSIPQTDGDKHLSVQVSLVALCISKCGIYKVWSHESKKRMLHLQLKQSWNRADKEKQRSLIVHSSEMKGNTVGHVTFNTQRSLAWVVLLLSGHYFPMGNLTTYPI